MIFNLMKPVPVQTATMYSYNGTVLPALPEWDKETYPYAYIRYEDISKVYCDGCFYAILFCCDTLPTIADVEMYGTTVTQMKFSGNYLDYCMVSNEKVLNGVQNGGSFVTGNMTDISESNKWFDMSNSMTRTTINQTQKSTADTQFGEYIWFSHNINNADNVTIVLTYEPIPIYE